MSAAQVGGCGSMVDEKGGNKCLPPALGWTSGRSGIGGFCSQPLCLEFKKKKKRYKQTYLQNRNRLRERTYGYQGEGLGGGIDWEFGFDMCTLLCLKQIINKDLLYSTGNSAQYSVIT